MNSNRINICQQSTPIFTFQNNFTAEHPFSLRFRSYKKIENEFIFADSIDGNFLDYLNENSSKARTFLCDMEREIDPRLVKRPFKKPNRKRNYTKRDIIRMRI